MFIHFGLILGISLNNFEALCAYGWNLKNAWFLIFDGQICNVGPFWLVFAHVDVLGIP